MQIQKPNSPYIAYLIECKKCGKQHIGETKRHPHERLGEHRRSILNYGRFPNSAPVSEHLNQADHSFNDILSLRGRRKKGRGRGQGGGGREKGKSPFFPSSLSPTPYPFRRLLRRLRHPYP